MLNKMAFEPQKKEGARKLGQLLRSRHLISYKGFTAVNPRCRYSRRVRFMGERPRIQSRGHGQDDVAVCGPR